MKEYIAWMNKLPLWAKFVIAIIPCVQILWGLYRLFTSIEKNNLVAIIIAILLIIPGASFMWLVDAICILLKGKIFWID